jgi:putative membrane protein
MSKDRHDNTQEAKAECKTPHATISEDKQAAEYLANERTFLAWVRTSIAVISLGFVVTKFSLWMHEIAARLDPNTPPRRMGASLPIGVTLMALGSLLVVLAATGNNLIDQQPTCFWGHDGSFLWRVCM